MEGEFKSELTIEALDENLKAVQQFVRDSVRRICSDNQTLLQLDLVVEEVFVNISHYAYAPGTGTATVICTVCNNPASLIMTFIDSGKPFNPLKRPDPDITLGAEDRDIGGLGIFLVKKYMSSTEYNYADGKNIFTLTRKF